MFSFLRKKTEQHLLTYLEKGMLPCSSCKKEFSLSDVESLKIVESPVCNHPNFIPKKVHEFWLIHPLGGGGMGTVYKAYREGNLQDYFAVKVLPRAKKNTAELIKSLQSEATVLKNIGKHPNIVSWVADGYKNDEHFLATEFVDGERLDKRIQRIKNSVKQRVLSSQEALFITLQLLSAESHIYNQGYLFRDLKPENILITKQKGALLYDYGICTTLEKAASEPGEIIEGSPFYMPPERLIEGREGPHSEIYSLGMILYEMLKGKTYFSAKELCVLARKLTRSVRLTNEDKMKKIDEKIVPIIHKMIKRQPNERYQNFFDVENDILQAFLHSGL